MVENRHNEAIVKCYGEQMYPSYQSKINKLQKINKALKIFIFLVLLSMSIAFAFPWYVYIGSNLLFFSVCAYAIFYKKKNKIFNIFVFFNIMLIMIDLGDKKLDWAFNYVIPLLITLAAIILFFIMVLKKNSIQSIVKMQIKTIIITLILNFLLVIKITTVLWPSLAALIVTVMSIIFVALILRRAYFITLKRILHV